jgi:hypothetical protein
MLRELHEEGLHTLQDCRLYVGRMFRSRLYDLPPDATDEDATEFLVRRCILIHLDNDIDKFHALVFMTQKLFDLAQNKCKVSKFNIKKYFIQLGMFTYTYERQAPKKILGEGERRKKRFLRFALPFYL